jgi:hypothetical protein
VAAIIIVSAITGDMVETWWTWRHGQKGAIKWWRRAIGQQGGAAIIAISTTAELERAEASTPKTTEVTAIIIATTTTKFHKAITPTTTAEAMAITTAIIATTRRACLGDNDNPEQCGSVELWKLSGAQEQQ